jgi:hypothetical protein
MSKKAGFGAIGIIVVIAGLVLLALIGWRIYDANKQHNSGQADAGQKATSKNDSPQSSPSKPASYLDMVDLGIKLKLSDSIKDLTYSTVTLTDGSKAAKFSTETITTADANCSADFGPLGSLEMTTNDTNRAGSKKAVDNVDVFKLDKYYLTYSSPQALCSDKALNLTSGPRAALREAFKTMQLDQ